MQDQDNRDAREQVISEMFLGDAAAYEKSLETYMDGCAAFAEESAEWLDLDPYRFYSVDMWNKRWEESGNNASGSVDCRWAFHRERKEILREAEASYLDEALSLLELANEEEYDQDQLARMRQDFTGVDKKVWLDRQQQAHTPQDAPYATCVPTQSQTGHWGLNITTAGEVGYRDVGLNLAWSEEEAFAAAAAIERGDADTLERYGVAINGDELLEVFPSSDDKWHVQHKNLHHNAHMYGAFDTREDAIAFAQAKAQPAPEDAPHPDGQIVVLNGDTYRWDNFNDLWLDEQSNFLDRNTVTWRVVQAVGALVSKTGEIDKDAIIDVLQGDTEEERDDLLTQAHDEIGETEEAARAFKAWNDALTEGDAYTPKNHQKISEAQDAYYAARKESTARPEVQQRWQELQADESTEYGITIQAIEVIRSAQIAYHPGWNGLNREQRLDILRAATEGTMEAETMQESTKLPFRAIPNELAKRVVTHIKADVLGRDVYAEAADLYNFDQQESDDDWLEGVTLPEKAAPLPEKPPQMPYNWNGGELEVQASVTLTSRDGKEHVVPAANLGVEPEFWAVYARLKDGTAEWVRDFNTQHEAQRFADQQPLNQVRRIGEFNLPDGGYRGSMIEFATTDAQREGVTRLFYNTTGQPFDEVDGYKIKQVDFVEGQWWVRGQLTPKPSTPPTAADMPVSELQAQVERHALRNIEIRQEQQGSKPAKSSSPVWQQEEDAVQRDKKWVGDDMREFELITDPDLRARAAAVMVENARKNATYQTMLGYSASNFPERLEKLAATAQPKKPQEQEAPSPAPETKPTRKAEEQSRGSEQALWGGANKSGFLAEVSERIVEHLKTVTQTGDAANQAREQAKQQPRRARGR